MNILIISRNAWDETNAIGNTLSNFFGEFSSSNFANIYFRSSKPNNKICKKYYQVTEFDIIKGWFSSHNIGTYFEMKNDSIKNCSFNCKNERRIIKFIHTYKFNYLYYLSERIWYSKKWINEKLYNFIESFSPDIVFSFVKFSPQYYLTIKLLKEKYNIPLITWIADDEYTNLDKNKSIKNIKKLQYILEKSNLVLGCSKEICQYYNMIFGCNAKPFYKGCSFFNYKKNTSKYGFKIVYAGNLLYGRLDVLKLFINAIEMCSSIDRIISIDIYSNTSLSKKDIKAITEKNFVSFHGHKSYEEIKIFLSEADIVLFVESFCTEEILKTKYSFSTKIIDCIQSGSLLLAIGPSGNASIEYIKKIPGAYVIDNLDNLNSDLYSFFDQSEKFLDKALSINDFAHKYHDGRSNSKNLENMFLTLTKESN